MNMVNFVNSENLKIIETGIYKNIPIKLMSLDYNFEKKYLIIIGSDKQFGDGYIYDNLLEAQKDYRLMLEGKLEIDV